MHNGAKEIGRKMEILAAAERRTEATGSGQHCKDREINTSDLFSQVINNKIVTSENRQHIKVKPLFHSPE